MAAESLPEYKTSQLNLPSPRYISFAPNGKQVYVTSTKGNVVALSCGALTVRPFKWIGHDVQGMAFSEASRSVFVVDREYGVIGEFDMKGGLTHSRQLDIHSRTNGPLHRYIGTPSPKSNFFNEPLSGIAYIADDQKRRPWVFDIDLEKLKDHEEVMKKEGRTGIFSSVRRDFIPHVSALQWPTDIALDGNGYIYVADTWNHRVAFFSEKGDFIGEFGRYGKCDGEFQLPSCVCWDFSNETLVVGDGGNARIQIFSRDHKHVLTFGSRGNEKGQFVDIGGIAVDTKNGVIFASDPKLARISAFSRDGAFLYDFGSDLLKSPIGIAICPAKGQLWVADNEAGTCLIWSLPGSPYQETEWISCEERQEERDAKVRRKKAKEDSANVVVPSSPAFDPNARIHVKLTIVNAELRRGTDMDGKSDPYVVTLLAGRALGKTAYCKRTLTPVWNHSICFPTIPSEKQEVTFQIYDHDFIKKDDLVGTALWNIPTEIPTSVTLVFTDPNSKQRAGHLLVTIEKVK